MKFAVLLSCHNRRDKTLRCLDRLFAESLPAGVELAAYLVDDGSSDGTGDAVRVRFPAVQIIEGDGSLFWCGGMRRAWAEAAKSDFDGYIWLNDDTDIQAGGLVVLLETLALQERDTGGRGIVVGTSRDPATGTVSFGAYGRRGPLPPPTAAGPIRAFNGNLVLVSREAFRALGNLSPKYQHSFGDVDYGLRAEQAGVPVWIAPGFLAECGRNPPAAWTDPKIPFRQRWRALHGPKGVPPRELIAFTRLSLGWLWPLALGRVYLRVSFPSMFRGWRVR